MDDARGAVTIKPHHFMDIIKLYGTGLSVFVPDEEHGHDFYRIGNRVLADRSLPLVLTVGADAICAPCRSLVGDNCADGLDAVRNYDSKDAWNREIDARILGYAGLSAGQTCTALELCERLYAVRDKIPSVWAEEDDARTRLRLENFTRGAEKYLAEQL